MCSSPCLRQREKHIYAGEDKSCASAGLHNSHLHVGKGLLRVAKILDEGD